MRILKNALCLFLLALCSLMVSCGDDSDDPSPVKSSAKAITSFKFSGLNPEVTGTISESEKKISLVVPAGTDVTALVPTIIVSNKATITPGSGIAGNFTNPVIYTVEAEDGSEQDYTVTVIISDDESVTIDELPETTVEQESVFTIEGSNFGDPENIKIVLKHVTTEDEEEIVATSTSTASILYFDIPSGLPIGEYTITLHIGDESFELDETVTIQSPAPSITSVNKTTVASGETLVITGTHFAESGNEVKFEDDGFSFGATIVTESSTMIEVTVPETISDGPHTLVVIVNEIEVEYDQAITIGAPSEEPSVTSINKTTFNRGETIVITGANLDSDGVSTTLYFWPTNGVALQRVAQVNEEGTELTYTIPLEFTAGEYEIEIHVDFEPLDYSADIIIN